MVIKDELQLKLIGGILYVEERYDKIAKFLANPYNNNSNILWYNAVVSLISFNNDCQSVSDPYYAIYNTIGTLPNGIVWFDSLSNNNTYENFVNNKIGVNQNIYSSFNDAITSKIGFGFQYLEPSEEWKQYDSTEQQVVMRFDYDINNVLGAIVLRYIMPAYDYKLLSETYDYIIVGAGAAGSILAARLSETKDVTILLLDVGPDNQYISVYNNNYDKEISTVPILDGVYLKRYHNDPYINDSENLKSSPSLLDYTTLKQKDRFFGYPRGCGNGGSTSHHAMYDGRGTPLVYDRIAQELNDDIWLYKNILPYYKKMESYNVPNSNPEIHGYDGWLQIRKNGKLNTDLKLEMIQVFVDDFNIPYSQDPADPNQVSGVYISEEQVGKDGLRSNSFNDLLKPTNNKNRNVLIRFNTLVNNIILENNLENELCAKGVVVYHKPYVSYGNITGNIVYNYNQNAKLPNKDLPPQTKYFARKEVIICSGAINTPQLLMLSGIGPKDELDKIGVNVILDKPGVGRNLLDHPFCTSIYEMDPKKILWQWQATYMKYNTNYLDADPEIIKNIEKYSDVESYSNNTFGLGYDMPTGIFPSTINDPDVHTQIGNKFLFDSSLDFDKFPTGDNYQQLQHDKDSYLPDRNDPTNYSKGIPNYKPFLINSQTDPLNPRTFLSFLPELLYLKGLDQNGSITLKNNDPREQPIIDLGYYKDEVGIERLATTILNLRKFMHSPGMLKYAKDPEDYELFPGKVCDTKESIIQYLKVWQLFGYHIAGTAKMGLPDDKMSIVDSRLKVFGVKGLRIVDASVYPKPHLHAYNISRGVYLIAEVISDIIKSENI